MVGNVQLAYMLAVGLKIVETLSCFWFVFLGR